MMDPDQQHNPSSSQHFRVDRKTIEKNRRIHMKSLYSKLNSIVPHNLSREVVSVPDQLEETANYIKKLLIKLERMKQKKDSLVGIETPNNINAAGLKSLHIDVHEMGSALEVVLITGLDFQFMFNETIRLLHEEGVDVVNASLSIVNDTIFHTIHSKVGDEYATGNAASRISERLKNFVYGCNSYDAK